MMAYVTETAALVEALTAVLHSPQPDYREAGRLLSTAHALLRDQVACSTPLIEECVSRVLAAGAYGAKLSGSGHGGCLVAPVPDDAVAPVPRSPAGLPLHARRAAGAGAAPAAGGEVLDAALGSTAYAYYVSGALGTPAAMITASHNPAAYNGIKLCRAGAAPVGEDTGLAEIRAWLAAGDIPGPVADQGTVTSQDMRADYVSHLRSLVPLEGIRPLKGVADAGNGMPGHMAPAPPPRPPPDLA